MHVLSARWLHPMWYPFYDMVRHAIENGKQVELASRPYLGKGRFWRELVIDGDPVPGSRIYARDLTELAILTSYIQTEESYDEDEG